MSFFRSERMSYCHLVLHQETAFDCLVELGYLGKVQFINEYDKNRVPNMKFVHEVQRCTEAQRIIQKLQEEVNNSDMVSFYYPNVDRDEIPSSGDLPEIETILQGLEDEFTDVLRHCDALIERRIYLTEYREVLLKANDFLTSAMNAETQMTSSGSLIMDMLMDGSHAESGRLGDKIRPLNFLTVSVPVEKSLAFERMVWRVSRGNAYVKRAQFELPEEILKRSSQSRFKNAFVVMYVGGEMNKKLTKICHSFQTHLYSCPVMEAERLKKLDELKNELKDLEDIFGMTCQHKRRILSAAIPYLYIWRSKLKKIHDVYVALNRLSTVREIKNRNLKYLQTCCWIPKSDISATRSALMVGARRSARGDPSMTFPPILNERNYHPTTPPTYFATNKFTYGFQHLIDAYGYAAYQELNPTPYTIVTFPFLFGIMFGDIGHGLIMALFAYMLIRREKKIERDLDEAMKSNEIFEILFGGRYIIFLMGLFSIYTGFMYNDLLSKPVNIFEMSWHAPHNMSGAPLSHATFIELDPVRKDQYRGHPYIFGVDPAWVISSNAIIQMNSIKMKCSIIFGVLQMMFGLTLSAWNNIFFKNKIDLYLVFLPQIVFISCLFFYLVIMIFYKWSWYGGNQIDEYRSACAPSILIAFINMVMLKSPAENPIEDCKSTLYAGEAYVERFLLFTALFAVPILLCGKPLHFMYEHRRINSIVDTEKQNAMRRSTITKIRKSLIYNVEFSSHERLHEKQEPPEKLSEVWIHQGIHTIECVLGSVSHTASYLRLWALSLAHSQLSHVLWSMVLRKALVVKMPFAGGVMIFFVFGAFAMLTVSILVLMEGLSAFLHTLRLHWVEFQSKFYGGTGDPFVPFRFQPTRKRDAGTAN